jgi:outer membrane protein OmpA-like peptidoglycan-associated protein
VTVRPILFGILLSAALAPVPSPAPAATCQEIYAAAEAAQSADALVVLYEAAVAAPDCDEAFRRALGRRVAAAMVTEVEAAVATGAALAGQQAALEASLPYARLWQVLATLGDIAETAGDYLAAARRYQEALEVIDDPDTPDAPPVAVIEQLFRKAETARLLADAHVETPRNRAGEPSGLGARDLRGFEVTKVAVPITFVTAEALFTELGAQAADDLFFILQAEGMPDIKLVGHTDPRGSEAYNQALSERRVAAVRDYLLSRGYVGGIGAQAKGESEPFQSDDSAKYTQEQLWQMDRRVELRFPAPGEELATVPPPSPSPAPSPSPSPAPSPGGSADLPAPEEEVAVTSPPPSPSPAGSADGWLQDRLTGGEILQLVSGNTVYRAGWWGEMWEYYSLDGRLGGTGDPGSWWIAGDELCLQFQSSDPVCDGIWQNGSEYYNEDEDIYITPGNPYGF